MILEDNADFHEINLLNKQDLLLVFCLSFWVFIFDCQTAVSSSESIPVHILFVPFLSHANMTIFYSFAFSCLFNIPVTCELVLCDISLPQEQTSERHVVHKKIERWLSRSAP